MYEVLVQEEPYKPLDAVQAASQVITHQVKLKFPDVINVTLREIGTSCLSWEPNERPDFEIICDMLNNVQ